MQMDFPEPNKIFKHSERSANRLFAALSASLLLTSAPCQWVLAADPGSSNTLAKKNSAQNVTLPSVPDLAVPKHYTIRIVTPPVKGGSGALAAKTSRVTPGEKSSLPATPVIPDLPVPAKSGVAAGVATGAATDSATGRATPQDRAQQEASPKLDPKNNPKGVLNQALKAYESGHYGQAAAILATDLQANPDDGTVHYYMGLALKKEGHDMPALHELEKAARLCPPEMIKRFADEQIGNLDEPEPLKGIPSAATAPAKNDWLAGLGSGINQMFGIKPQAAPPTVGGTTSSGNASGSGGGGGGGGNSNGSNVSNSSSSGSTGNSSGPFPGMPDILGQIKDAIKQGKTILRNAQNKDGAGKVGSVDFSRSRSGEAEIMHMDEMQALVQKSHAIGVPDWSSSSDGLKAFPEAPENTREWDYWIGRFKRSFQHVLLRRLNAEAKDQVRGAAACIFSLDRQGNLRGQVYASTADSALNKCLVEAVRDLNHSRILAFPSTSHINGWNFQMSWNFGIYLAIVKAYRQQKERQEALETAARVVLEETKAKAKLKAEKDKIAVAKKLAAEKALKAKLARPAPETKIEVSGQVVTPAVERELKAVALELKDLTPVAPNAAQPNVDPFATIDDHTINSWPDLNR